MGAAGQLITAVQSPDPQDQRLSRAAVPAPHQDRVPKRSDSGTVLENSLGGARAEEPVAPAAEAAQESPVEVAHVAVQAAELEGGGAGGATTGSGSETEQEDEDDKDEDMGADTDGVDDTYPEELAAVAEGLEGEDGSDAIEGGIVAANQVSQVSDDIPEASSADTGAGGGAGIETGVVAAEGPAAQQSAAAPGKVPVPVQPRARHRRKHAKPRRARTESQLPGALSQFNDLPMVETTIPILRRSVRTPGALQARLEAAASPDGGAATAAEGGEEPSPAQKHTAGKKHKSEAVVSRNGPPAKEVAARGRPSREKRAPAKYAAFSETEMGVGKAGPGSGRTATLNTGRKAGKANRAVTTINTPWGRAQLGNPLEKGSKSADAEPAADEVSSSDSDFVEEVPGSEIIGRPSRALRSTVKRAGSQSTAPAQDNRIEKSEPQAAAKAQGKAASKRQPKSAARAEPDSNDVPVESDQSGGETVAEASARMARKAKYGRKGMSSMKRKRAAVSVVHSEVPGSKKKPRKMASVMDPKFSGPLQLALVIAGPQPCFALRGFHEQVTPSLGSRHFCSVCLQLCKFKK